MSDKKPEDKELENQIKGIRSQGEQTPLSDSQIEILKRYIELKETEAQDLRQQQRQYQEHTQKAAVQIDLLTQQNQQLVTELHDLQRHTARLQAEMEEERREHQEQLILMRSDFEEKLKQAGANQEQLRDLIRQKEEFKEKIREDLKRIKLKEKELENKYELLRNDTQTLLDAKDKQILDVKKKADALDLELEQYDDRLRESARVLNEVSVKKRRLIDTLKLAIQLLEDIDQEAIASDSEPERKAG